MKLYSETGSEYTDFLLGAEPYVRKLSIHTFLGVLTPIWLFVWSQASEAMTFNA